MDYAGPLTGITVINGGSYTAAPSVVIAPPSCVAGPNCAPTTATVSLAGAPVTGFTLLGGGSKFKSIPIVTFGPPPAGGYCYRDRRPGRYTGGLMKHPLIGL
jgi:hypothetical protein